MLGYLALAVVFLPAPSIAQTFVCKSSGGSFSYQVDLTTEQIVVGDGPALDFDRISTDAEVVVAGQVNLPVPDHLAEAPLVFELAERSDGIFLIDRFSYAQSDQAFAFAPVEEIMQTAEGIPCTYQE